MSEVSEQSLYQILGEAEGLRLLVNRFYIHMDTRPEVKLIRDMHDQDLSLAKDKLFMFLSGWTGGPPLFVERYGHPRLRARHLPFKIDKQARDMWLQCMILALDDLKIAEDPRRFFIHALAGLANHMRNQPESD